MVRDRAHSGKADTGTTFVSGSAGGPSDRHYVRT